MKNVKNFIWIGLSTALLVSCFPEEAPVYPDKVEYSLRDAGVQKLYNHINTMELDSILSYTSHGDPNYRYIVASTFAAQSHTGALDSLNILLKDNDITVRTAAAYALGQQKDTKAQAWLTNAFVSQDSLRKYEDLNATILEALGKVGDKKTLESIASVKTYSLMDKKLLKGQARCLYQYMLRGIHSPKSDALLLDMITEKGYPTEVREIAANALHRSNDVDVSQYWNRLHTIFLNDPNPNIRMALAKIMSKSPDASIRSDYIKHLKEEKDYRVLVNMIAHAGNLPYISVIEPILGLLSHENQHVALTAGQYLIDNGNATDASIYRSFIKSNMPPLVKNKVSAAVMRHLPAFYTGSKTRLRNELLASYTKSNNLYDKVDIIRTIAQDPLSFKAIVDMKSDTISPPLLSALAGGIQTILTNKNLPKLYRGRRLDAFMKEAADSLASMAATKDAGTIAVIGEIFKNKDIAWEGIITDPTFLKTAASSLKMPQDVEAYKYLEEAYLRFRKDGFPKVKEYIPRPIDWNVYAQTSDSLIATIQTNYGVIQARLLSKQAPITVAHFVNLAKSQFYNDKNIHRVVPNFVIQDGCPRGDGYGSLDYTMPSELYPARYEVEGYLGMASAGKNTECSQWFITHSPTMHLNGRYTIFGKVIKGMDVVHKINQGDAIKSISISKEN